METEQDAEEAAAHTEDEEDVLLHPRRILQMLQKKVTKFFSLRIVLLLIKKNVFQNIWRIRFLIIFFFSLGGAEEIDVWYRIPTPV